MQLKNRIIALVFLLCGYTATWGTQQVTVTDTQNGTVTVDKPNAAAGEIVTITVTPAAGYEISKKEITAKATIDPSIAHAPRLTEAGPDVGMDIELQGEDPSDLGQEHTYTFTMPESPLNVLISATFTKSVVTAIDEISAPAKTGQRYNLMGRPVGNDYKGMVIENGRKIVVR